MPGAVWHIFDWEAMDAPYEECFTLVLLDFKTELILTIVTNYSIEQVQAYLIKYRVRIKGGKLLNLNS